MLDTQEDVQEFERGAGQDMEGGGGEGGRCTVKGEEGSAEARGARGRHSSFMLCMCSCVTTGLPPFSFFLLTPIASMPISSAARRVVGITTTHSWASIIECVRRLRCPAALARVVLSSPNTS